MQVITNEQFVASRARIGKIGTLLGLAAFFAGFFTSLNIELIGISYALLIFGLFAFNVGRYNSVRWGTRPRQDEILANALKGLDHKHVLLNYAGDVPASHLLLSPLGLFVIEPRIHDGEIACEGSRWRRKRSFTTIVRSFVEGGLGNPTRDAQRVVAGVKSFLVDKLGAERAEVVPLEAVIVFTSPLVQLKVTDPVVPVVKPDDLKAQVRSVQGRTKMAGELYRRLHEVLTVNNNRLSAASANYSHQRRRR